MATKQAHALSAGASVSATLVETTGPKAQVTGARTTPTRVPDVFDSRLAPSGTLTTPEKNGLCRWAMAQAGQAMNHTSWAGSPHAEVRVEAGCPSHTCHQRTTAGSAKSTMARAWKPTARATRSARLRGRGGGSGAAAPGGSSPPGGSGARSSGGGDRRVGWVVTSVALVTPTERSAALLVLHGGPAAATAS